MKNNYGKAMTLALLSVLLLAGCGNKPKPSEVSTDSETPTDVTTEDPSSEEPSEEPSSEVNGKDNLSFDLVDLSKVYDGKPVAPDYPSFELNGVLIEPICDYKKLGEGDQTYTTTAPIDYGYYVFRLRVEENEKFNAFEATRQFRITKRQLTFNVPKKWEFPENKDGTNVYKVTFDESNGAVPGTNAFMFLHVFEYVTDKKVTKPGEYVNVRVDYSFLLDDNYRRPDYLPSTITVRIYELRDFIAYTSLITTSGDKLVSIGATVKHGIIRVNDYVYLEGAKTTTMVTGITKDGKPANSAMQGEEVTLELLDGDPTKIKLGDAIMFPDPTTSEFKSITTFKAIIYLFTEAQGGRASQISPNYRPSIYYAYHNEKVKMTDFRDKNTNAPLEVIKPGEEALVTITLLNGPRVILADIDGSDIMEGTQRVGYLEAVSIN